jgi:hypothetical protein
MQKRFETTYQTYIHRNDITHGESLKSAGGLDPLDIQHLAWKYLRISIILFAWIEENSDLMSDGELSLGDVLIDEEDRNELIRMLEDFKITEYLPITA